jgi:hypothetical protein
MFITSIYIIYYCDNFEKKTLPPIKVRMVV